MSQEGIGFLPLKRMTVNRVVPTEDEKKFRLQLLKGYVHDPGAAMFGGVAGHAGLFSDAYDLACLMQMLLDSVPFVLMAVDPAVLSLYYLSYATNGFFQHCNIDLRYGLLNYVVGSAETHRWHHSREPREANANYGNTVIVWDVLFGTWFLPADRAIGALGLHQKLPASFRALMAAPFRK